MATSRAVNGVLVQLGPDGPEAVRRFTRQRAVSVAGMPNVAPVGVTEPADSSFGQEYTLQFGDSGGGTGRDLFLSSEFSGIEGGGEEAGAAPAVTFEMELLDILAECLDAGYDLVDVAFVLPSLDVSYVELTVAEALKGKNPDRETLLELLGAQHRGAIDEERVAFVPIAPSDAAQVRRLAVLPRPKEPVAATLRALEARKERLPAVSLLDAEFPAYVGLVRGALRLDGAPADADAEPASTAGTLLVRAGADDTLVVFMRGDDVQHFDVLHSLTAADSPETICSRILLQQDEHGMGDVHRVLVLSEDSEEPLVEAFEMFFPEARVESLRDYLPVGSRDVVGTSTSAVLAAVGALRQLRSGGAFAGAFEPVNLLPKALSRRRRQIRVPITWPTILLTALFALSFVLLSATYTQAETEIGALEERLQEYDPALLSGDINTLQARIDSMQALHASYVRALDVLDTLLLGSDRWSRALEKTSATAAAVEGIWVEQMRPQNTALILTGNATSRDRVVDFAQRIDGDIESLSFSEIRERPIFAFQIRLVVYDELPAVSKYLRAQVAAEASASQAPSTSP